MKIIYQVNVLPRSKFDMLFCVSELTVEAGDRFQMTASTYTQQSSSRDVTINFSHNNNWTSVNNVSSQSSISIATIELLQQCSLRRAVIAATIATQFTAHVP